MTPPLDLENASELIERAQSVIDGAVRSLKLSGGVDAHQSLAYDVAHAASALATRTTVDGRVRWATMTATVRGVPGTRDASA